MNASRSPSLRNDLYAALALLAALIVTAVAYAPGLGGSFHFDDDANLAGLSQVGDSASAIRFIFEGIAGPLGRPLALASFVPQAYAWPVAPDVFLYTNVCVHLLNGVLVVWLLYLLSLAQRRPIEDAGLAAAIGGCIWMLLPILASSSLLIVQRMTTLSATFLLAGFIAYLLSRRLCDRRPRLGLLWMSASLIAGTVAAALAKENGALLPVFVLAAEVTLLREPAWPSTFKARPWWTCWRLVFLVAPAAVLLGYLALSARYGEEVLLMREFTVSDRLLTQAHILWEYLLRAFVPVTSTLGPFHDDHVLHRSWLSPTSVLAVGAWLAAIACAIVLRRRAPLFSFAVGWYLAGHMLESTTIPLELYFEHRNYLPLIGPVYALAAGAMSITGGMRRLVRASIGAYALLLSVILFSTTSLWGQPPLAAEIWATRQPGSLRANQYLGLQLLKAGDTTTLRRVFSRYVENHPGSAAVELQILMLDCVAEPEKSHAEALAAMKARIQQARFEYAVFETLRDLYRVAKDEKCETIDTQAVYELAAAAASNPAFKAVPVMQHNLHILMSEEAFAARNLDLTMHHLESALDARYTMTTLLLAVKMLISAGLYSTAQEFVEDARAKAPLHPVRASLWNGELDAVDHAIEAIRHDES